MMNVPFWAFFSSRMNSPILPVLPFLRQSPNMNWVLPYYFDLFGFLGSISRISNVKVFKCTGVDDIDISDVKSNRGK